MHMQQQIEIPRSKTGDVPSSSVETVSLFGFSHPPYFHLVHLDGGYLIPILTYHYQPNHSMQMQRK